MGIILILVPMLIAAVVAFNHSVTKAFLYVYIPSLILLPNYYSYDFVGIPDPNFNQGVILSIFAVWVLQGMQGWRFSFTDGLVVIFVLTRTISQYLNLGYDDAQNFFFNMTTSIIMPYIIAKSIIAQDDISVDLAKIIILLLVLAFIITTYQYISSSHHTLWQQILGPFFGNQGWGWVTRYRGNLPRLAGPFAHAILFALIMFAAFWLALWLARKGAWENNIFGLPPFALGYGLVAMLFIAGVLGLSRGPFLGWFAAATIVLIGFSRRRWLWFTLMMGVLTAVSIPIANTLVEYSALQRAEAGFGTMQETIVYRTHLLQNYIDIANQNMLWGWGIENWPSIPGQRSIDNHYLLVYLEHGIIAIISFILIILYVGIRLFMRVMLQPLAEPRGSSLGFALLGVISVFTVSIGTVYLAQQLLPLFFIVIAWSEAYLRQNQYDLVNIQNTALATNRNNKFNYQRVLR
jgi:hypothetical protein